ncbi:SMC-Scp complex subunit ScpB [Terriglobus sp.]|uniref:SMC-Scp complex subunit ScpB n=1 Tax=Terriglobus sp. TaxID=1889013 RepID=UPI003B00DD70
MSLKSKIEAVIYASEEPVTLAQLVVLLSEEAQSELNALAARQAELPLGGMGESADAVDEATGSVDEAAAIEPLPSAQTETADASAPAAADSETANDHRSASESANVAGFNPEPDTPPQAPVANTEAEKRQARERERAVRDYLRGIVDTLIREYADSDRGLEIREVAGGFRFGTKPEYHDAVRGFVKSLKPALKLSLQALETLAVVAYKQPVTAAEISEIRGVDSAGVLGGLLTRKLIQTAGRKQVIGRPMLYKTTKEFLVRFGLRDVQELPSMEEFERMAGELADQEDLPMDNTDNVIERANARGDAEHIRETNNPDAGSGTPAEVEAASPSEEAGQAPPSASESHVSDNQSHHSTSESETGNFSVNAASSPRSEAAPASAEQEPA